MTIDVKEIKRLVVRMPNWLGDAVMATPVLQDLKSHFPHAHITALASEPIAQLLSHNPAVTEFLTFSRNSKVKRKEAKRVIEELRARKFDLGLLLTGSFSSAWQFYRAGLPIRLGFQDHFRSPLLTEALPLPENWEREHLVTSYKLLLGPLHIPVSHTKPNLHLSDSEKIRAVEILKEHGISKNELIIGINPGAAYGSAKCWLPERFKKVTAELLKDPKKRIIYFGDATTKPLVDDICKDFSESVINLAAKTNLRELIALIAKCHCFLTNDSGPMHVASAVNAPLVAIFGSTNEVKTGPYNGGEVIHNHVPCSPCYLRKCPIDFRCMRSITVTEVLDAIHKCV